MRPLSAGILNPVLNDFQPAQWRPASIRWLDESLHFIALGDDDVLDTKGLDHERNARGLFSVTTRFGRFGELIKTVGASIFGGRGRTSFILVRYAGQRETIQRRYYGRVRAVDRARPAWLALRQRALTTAAINSVLTSSSRAVAQCAPLRVAYCALRLGVNITDNR